jgi:hypothetical protein
MVHILLQHKGAGALFALHVVSEAGAKHDDDGVLLGFSEGFSLGLLLGSGVGAGVTCGMKSHRN